MVPHVLCVHIYELTLHVSLLHQILYKNADGRKVNRISYHIVEG